MASVALLGPTSPLLPAGPRDLPTAAPAAGLPGSGFAAAPALTNPSEALEPAELRPTEAAAKPFEAEAAAPLAQPSDSAPPSAAAAAPGGFYPQVLPMSAYGAAPASPTAHAAAPEAPTSSDPQPGPPPAPAPAPGPAPAPSGDRKRPASTDSGPGGVASREDGSDARRGKQRKTDSTATQPAAAPPPAPAPAAAAAAAAAPYAAGQGSTSISVRVMRSHLPIVSWYLREFGPVTMQINQLDEQSTKAIQTLFNRHVDETLPHVPEAQRRAMYVESDDFMAALLENALPDGQVRSKIAEFKEGGAKFGERPEHEQCSLFPFLSNRNTGGKNNFANRTVREGYRVTKTLIDVLDKHGLAYPPFVRSKEFTQDLLDILVTESRRRERSDKQPLVRPRKRSPIDLSLMPAVCRTWTLKYEEPSMVPSDGDSSGDGATHAPRRNAAPRSKKATADKRPPNSPPPAAGAAAAAAAAAHTGTSGRGTTAAGPAPTKPSPLTLISLPGPEGPQHTHTRQPGLSGGLQQYGLPTMLLNQGGMRGMVQLGPGGMPQLVQLGPGSGFTLMQAGGGGAAAAAPQQQGAQQGPPLGPIQLHSQSQGSGPQPPTPSLQSLPANALQALQQLQGLQGLQGMHGFQFMGGMGPMGGLASLGGFTVVPGGFSMAGLGAGPQLIPLSQAQWRAPQGLTQGLATAGTGAGSMPFFLPGGLAGLQQQQQQQQQPPQAPQQGGNAWGTAPAAPAAPRTSGSPPGPAPSQDPAT